jgi:putative redox protein
MVTAKLKEGLVAEVTARQHHWISGVAEKLGGHDEGADPHELVEAALAACTVLTVQLYANRKGWPLESADVTVKIVSEGPQTQISREISYRGPLEEAQKARLTDIASRCPIHKLLESQVTVSTTATATR